MKPRHFLTLALSLSLALCLPLAAQDKGAAGDTERIDRTLPLQSGGHLTVDNDRGTTTIEGWDKDQVSIVAVKHFEGDDNRRAEWLRQTEVRIEGGGSSVNVKIVRPNNFCLGWCNYRAWVDLTVRAPRRVGLDVRSDRTPTKVSDIQGEVRVDGDRSQIDLRRVAGRIRINSDRGPVYMHDVEIRDGIDITTDRAPIELYATRFGGGGRLQTDRSSITLRIPENTPLTVVVERDRRSRFRTDFSLSTSGNLGGYGTLRGNINGGGPQLHLETDRGSISLEKGPPASGGSL